MKVIYIAGPFKAENSWQVEQNVRRAEEIALEVWRLGAVAVCPHTNTRFFLGTLPDVAVYVKGYIELVKRCDAVLTVSGYEWSHGAGLELDAAEAEGKPVFHNLGDLKAWLVG